MHALLHEPILHESIEALREDIGGETEAPLEVREPGRPPEECVAHDEQAPPLPDHFQGSGSRAVLAFEGAPQHKAHHNDDDCIMQVPVQYYWRHASQHLKEGLIEAPKVPKEYL